MSLKEQVIAASEQSLAADPADLTLETIARKVSQAVGRQLPPRRRAGRAPEADAGRGQESG